MPLSNDVNKRLVTITVTIKVYADGDIERSVFDNLLSEEVLAKTGETTEDIKQKARHLGLLYTLNFSHNMA